MSDLTPAQQRLMIVLDRIKESALNDADEAEVYCEVFDPVLEELHSNDFYGTEGQCDPRGDFRNGDWSLESRVEGIDD